MNLECTRTSPSTRSVLRFCDGEVIEALKALAVSKGYEISSNGKYFVWYPRDGNSIQMALVVDNIGTGYSIKKD